MADEAHKWPHDLRRPCEAGGGLPHPTDSSVRARSLDERLGEQRTFSQTSSVPSRRPDSPEASRPGSSGTGGSQGAFGAIRAIRRLSGTFSQGSKVGSGGATRAPSAAPPAVVVAPGLADAQQFAALLEAGEVGV